jgi:hypothetical protein
MLHVFLSDNAQAHAFLAQPTFHHCVVATTCGGHKGLESIGMETSNN